MFLIYELHWINRFEEMNDDNMKCVLRVILFPVTIFLSTMILFLEFITTFGIAVLEIISIIILVAGIVCFFNHDIRTGVEDLILSFIFCPFGLPRIVLWLLAILEFFNFKLKNL